MRGDAFCLRVILGILMLNIATCQDAPDITLISQKLDSGNYQMTCVVGEKSMNSAITWNEPLPQPYADDHNYNELDYVSEYIPPRNHPNNCSIGEQASHVCDTDWKSSPDWQLEHSLRSMLQPVTDRRWEEFKRFHTRGSEPYKMLAYIQNQLFFKIHVSIRIKEEAHLYLCDDNNPKRGNCYWITLRESSTNKTVIRKCTPERFFHKNECQNLTDVDHISSDAILSENEWRHFTIAKRFSNIYVWEMGNDKPVLNYLDNENGIATTNLIINSHRTAGYWKLHDYYYIYTTKETTAMLGPTINVRQGKFCVSIFVAMCDQCILKVGVILSNGNEMSDTTTIKPKQAMAWQEEKIITTISDKETQVQLRVSSQCRTNNCTSPYWAIDNFQICSENEKNCPPATFGRYCTECQRLFDSKRVNCDKSSICDLQPDGKSICRCAAGYTGESCTKLCHENWYGFECKEQCGYCRNTGCDSITGHCLAGGCSTKQVIGPDCKTRVDVVQKLRSTYSDTTSIHISWVPPIENGNIALYNITYTHQQFLGCRTTTSSNETLSSTVEKSSTSTIIKNLRPFSAYLIEVTPIAIMSGKPSGITANTKETESPEEAEIPTIIEVDTTDTTAEIKLQHPKCDLIKGQAEYLMTLSCSNNWCDKDPRPMLYADNTLLSHLLPYSNYTVKIEVRRNNRYDGPSMAKMFNTKVAVPKEVNKITAYSKNESSIFLRFYPQFPPTGQLERYLVRYCFKNLDGTPNCARKQFKPQTCKLWTHLHCLRITQLNSNLSYQVTVSAKNIGTDFGSPTTIENVKTTQSAPGAPAHLTSTWDDYYNLTLTWIHPSITNGQLTKFDITILSAEIVCHNRSFHVNEENYELQYDYTIPIDPKCFSSLLTIYISAFNMQGGPPAILEQIASPPKTPSFIAEPYINGTTNTTIAVNLPPQKDLENISSIYVVVSDTTLKPKVASSIEEVPFIGNKLDLSKYSSSWIAGELDLTTKAVEQIYIVGNNATLKSKRLNNIHNRQLHMDTTYIITIVLLNEFKEIKRYRTYNITANTRKQSQPANYVVFALLLLLILPVILWIIIRKNKNTIKNSRWFAILRGNFNLTHTVDNTVVIPLTTNTEGNPLIMTGRYHLRPNLPTAKPQVPITNTINNNFSRSVKITEFEQYVKESIANGVLKKQHELFPRGQTKPWDYGLLPQNKTKNRYNNLVAYDDTRVKLHKINDDPYSDYINANYIHGYKSPKAYIATQGPKVTTVNDFWRMVWQENVSYIVMLANVIEGGKIKSEQYWPNINECLTFGNIQVKHKSSRAFADYENRIFSVSSDGVVRRVRQLHFKSWPEDGVPLYSQTLAPLLRKLLTIPQGTSPVLVHCSAGVGRTGTIILCDLCLRMAAREGVVDVLKHQYNLRQQRPNLVDNLEQYKLAHLVLLECLIAPETNLTCDEKLEGTISQLLNSGKVAQQLEYLKDTVWQDQAMRPSMEVAAKSESSAKNRFQNITPTGYGRIHLSGSEGQYSDYINAVEVNGFRAPQRFIVTQQPLPNTISDFWRMIEEKGVTTIVSLNKINLEDETSCVFWPTARVSEILPVHCLSLKFVNKTKNDYYSIITIDMHNTNNDNTRRTVHLFILKTWPPANLIPDTEESLLKLWEETKNISTGNNPIVVTCYDGAKACGLFIAVSFIVEKMKLDQECDVPLAVRTVRRNRKQFVTELDQFIFLYKTVIAYLKSQ